MKIDHNNIFIHGINQVSNHRTSCLICLISYQEQESIYKNYKICTLKHQLINKGNKLEHSYKILTILYFKETILILCFAL